MTWTAMRELLHADDAERARRGVEHALATRTDYFIEYRLINSPRERWVSASGRGVYDNDRVVGMLGVVQDIDEQVATRERLRSDAESLETINRVGQMLSAELDLQKLVQSVTDAATELSRAEFGAFFYNVLNDNGESYMLYTLSGVPLEKFSSFPMPRATAIFAPTFRGEAIMRLDDVRKDPRFGLSAPYHGMPKGHLPVVSYLAVPVVSRTGEVLGGLFFGHSQPGVFDERAERIVTGLAGQAAIAVDNARLFETVQRARRDAEAMTRRFSTITATSRDLTLYEHGADLRYTWVFPVHPEHAFDNIGKTDADLLPAPEGERLLQLKRAVIDTGVGSRHEVSVTLPSGVRVYDIVMEPRRGADGQVIGVGGVAVDITDRKRAESALLRAQQAAHESEARLREADRRKDEFLAMLAHELRNPLAPIRTGLHLMRATANDPGAVRSVREMMERQLAHLVRLVDDLLDVSRITSGKIQLQLDTIALNQIVADAVDANRAAADAAGIAIDVRLADPAAALLVDPMRMVQVISNVLNNAVKFSEPGGRITVEAGVETGADQSNAIVAVSDQGVGIAPSSIATIFDMFVQGEQERRSQGGLGIGLALARRLIEMHGGSIDAHSAGRGRGSTFTMRVPMLPAAVKPAESGASSGLASSARRVLIVDDNEDSAAMLAMLVTNVGGEARTAHDGESAIREAAAFAPHVVLLDIGLPGMDGYETCRRIREGSPNDMMIVAITGWGQEEDKQRAREAGFHTHITKPADPIALESLLLSGRSS